MQTDEPAVLTWMLAIAPLMKVRLSAPGHHWWRELVTETWRCADHAWWLEREAFAGGSKNVSEMNEFHEIKPRPKLRDVMVELGGGGWDPGQVFG